MTDDLEGRSAPHAYGVDEGRETCARCGHTAPTCAKCGRDTPILGGHINGLAFCHTFSVTPQSCYTLTSREWSPD